MIQGERRFKCGSYLTEEGEYKDLVVVFDEISTINFYDETEEVLIAQLQPTDIAIIYAAICEMKKNSNE